MVEDAKRGEPASSSAVVVLRDGDGTDGGGRDGGAPLGEGDQVAPRVVPPGSAVSGESGGDPPARVREAETGGVAAADRDLEARLAEA